MAEGGNFVGPESDNSLTISAQHPFDQSSGSSGRQGSQIVSLPPTHADRNTPDDTIPHQPITRTIARGLSQSSMDTGITVLHNPDPQGTQYGSFTPTISSNATIGAYSSSGDYSINFL